MPVAASRAGSIKQLAEQQRSGSPVPSGAAHNNPKQPRRSVSTKASTSTPSNIFPEADTLPSTYTANSNSAPAAAGPSAQQQQQQDAADAALFRDMRSSLADFETQQRKLACMHASTAAGKSSSRPARMPPRQTAFYAALRSVLQQVLAETTPAGRHTRLVAAHAWYVGHRPRPVAADANLAAAMAASLSISSPGQQQQQQQQRRVGCLQGRGYGSRALSPDTAADSLGWDSDSCCYDPEQADAGQLDQQYYRTNGTSAAAEGAAARPMSAQHVQRLEAGARTVSGWPHGGSSSSSSNSNSGAADVPGLIPVGALPSSRFTACFPPNVQSSRPSTAAAAGSLSGLRKISTVTFVEAHQQQDLHYQQQEQQQQFVGKSAWSALMAQQAALESEVADSMHIFARQRARIEEDISRRQELAAVAAATAAAAATGDPRASPGRGRFLQHLDSQHQPSQVTAELALTAAGGSSGNSGGSSGVQLVVPDKVKAARKQHQQEGVQEVSVLQESTGLSDAVLAWALLPPPDVPYMSAFAQLPTYKPPPKAAAAKKKKKSGESEKGGKNKGGKGSSNSKASKAGKS